MPNDYFIDIINPADPGAERAKAVIPHRLYLNVYKYNIVAYENLRAARFVLENPKRIFGGIRELNEGFWCFTGKPQTWYIRESVQAPFPGKFVFAVYLNSRYVVYEWRAEIAAPDDQMNPVDWQNRYQALIWKSTS